MDNNIYAPDSPNRPTSYHEGDNSDEIDIKEIIAKVWYKRKFILICTGLFLLLGIFIAFTSPVSYTANCTLVPQSGGKGGGNLGGLASMMGVSMGTPMSGETLSPAVYPQIINSVPFCKDIMETPIIVKESNGASITLHDYYTDKRYRPTNLISTIKRYTIGLPGLLISTMRSESDPLVYSDTITGKVIVLTKEERRVIKAIQGNIQFESNPKDGYVKLGYSFSEPQPTAVIAQNMYSTLEKQVKNYKSQKQLDNLAFVEESYERARKDFMEKQTRLAAFQDANRDLASAMARTTERRLNSEYDVAYTVYNELAKQLEQAKISVKESTPVLTVIDPVVVPHQKSAPRRAIILIAFLFLGGVVSVGWVFAKPFVQEVVREVKESDKGQEIRDKGQETRDKRQGIRDKG